MTVAFEAGYTLPGGDLGLKHARILHRGNRLRTRSIVASSEVAGFSAAAAGNPLTYSRWRPFANGLSDPANLSGAAWTLTNLTVSSDGKTLTETTATGEHDASQAYTFTAVEHVVAFKVQRESIPEIQIRASDGTTSFTCFFDLRDGTVGTAANCVGGIVDLGSDQFLCRIYFTPLAATGVVELLASNGAETVSYTGDTANTITVKQAYTHASSATLTLSSFTALEADAFCIAAHNLGTGGGRITFEHDSNADATFTAIGSVSPSDNSPIMFIFAPVTSEDWRITVDRGVMPEFGVVRHGKLLQMERPFYGEHQVTRMNRDTKVIGNYSGSGELLGRSKKRTILKAGYAWDNLTYSWVRANLDGPNGLIQSVETEPCFVAWRPGETQDVDFLMRAETQPPQNKGLRDLLTFSMSGEAYSYE